jgi:recombination protein RecA
MNFDELKKSIEKNVKGVHCSVLSESDIATNRFWVKTPALDLNRILSGSLFKGIQSRNLVGIVGPEHTMKSSFMILCMAEAQKQNKKPIIIDTEGGINSDFCTRWGLNSDNIFYIYTPWIHEVKSIIAQIKDTGDTDMIIGLDSVGGLDRYKSFEDAQKGDPKADQGLLQKEIRGMLKLLLNVCVGQNSIGICTGHVYGMPSSVPMPDQIGGGKAMKLFPSVLIALKKKQLEEGGKIIGNEIIATTIKNRMYPPFQTATVHLNYTDGVKPYAGLLELAEKIDLVEKAGSWYKIKETGESLGQGAIKAMDAFIEHPEFLEKIDLFLKDTGYSTVSEEVKQAEELLQKEILGDVVEDNEGRITIKKTKKK